MEELSKREFSKLRKEMVENAIFARGVRSELGAQRHAHRTSRGVLARRLREFAYEDSPLPIEEGQTISQPYIVAFMTEALALEGGEKVLEIGAGSGYAAAVLSESPTMSIPSSVMAVGREGRRDAGRSWLRNVHVLHGDGTLGWPAMRPMMRSLSRRAAPRFPNLSKTQLKIGGRLVIPVGADQHVQELVRVTRIARAASIGVKNSPMCDLFRCSARKVGRPRRQSGPAFATRRGRRRH